MLKLSERGAAHLLAPLILLIGIFATYYLATHPTIFKPKAAFDNSSAVSVNGSRCANNVCEFDYDGTNPDKPVKFSIDVKALNEQTTLQNNSAGRSRQNPQ